MILLGKWHPLKEIMAWPRAISNPSISIVDLESLRNLYINFATEPRPFSCDHHNQPVGYGGHKKESGKVSPTALAVLLTKPVGFGHKVDVFITAA